MGGALEARGTAALALAIIGSIRTELPSSLALHLPTSSDAALNCWNNEENMDTPTEYGPDSIDDTTAHEIHKR